MILETVSYLTCVGAWVQFKAVRDSVNTTQPLDIDRESRSGVPAEAEQPAGDFQSKVEEHDSELRSEHKPSPAGTQSQTLPY